MFEPGNESFNDLQMTEAELPAEWHTYRYRQFMELVKGGLIICLLLSPFAFWYWALSGWESRDADFSPARQAKERELRRLGIYESDRHRTN